MKTKPRSTIAVLLLGAFLLAWAGTASAMNIVIEYVTVTLSSLAPNLQPTDTITIRNNGTLWVDNGGNVVTIGKLVIGEGITAGNVLFSGTNSTLVVAGDIEFGNNSANALDMAFLTPTTPHILKVGGKFLEVGTGRFSAGAATVEYYSSSAQTITSQVGGNAVVYKNLVLSSSGATATKTFSSGVSVQGTLTITDKVVPAGSPVSYGVLATLVYNGSVAQTTSGAEWPASPVPNIPITLNNAAGLTLDSDKTLGGSLILAAGELSDNGKTLTVQGNVTNSTAIKGKGRLVLAGSAAQYLAGTGAYGNLIVNNASGVTFPASGITTINGRLTITSGKITLPQASGSGNAHVAALFTYGGLDYPAGTYGSLSSGAPSPSLAFEGTGWLTVTPKPLGQITVNNTNPQTAYGDTTVTISGSVTNPVGPPNFSDYGNGVGSEQVTVTITPPSPLAPIVQSQTLANGAFSMTLNITGVPFGTWPILVTYAGGANLATNYVLLSSPNGLTVSPKVITVTPVNTNKIYGDPDPALTYTYAPALVAGDSFSGALSRVAGENVGAYNILQGDLSLSANYTITFVTGKQLTIGQKLITVLPDAKTKKFGDVDPALTFTYSPSLVGSDTMSGTLTRDAGDTVGSYLIKKGTVGDGMLNYNVQLSSTKVYLTITKLDLFIGFNTVSKVHGEKDSTASGNVAAYTFTPPLITGTSASGTAQWLTNQNVGAWPVVRSNGTSGIYIVGESNYNVTVSTTNYMVVTQRPVIVWPKNYTNGFGQTFPLASMVGYETAADGTGRGLISQSGGLNGAARVTGFTNVVLNPAVPASSNTPMGLYPFSVASPGSHPNYLPVAAYDPTNTAVVKVVEAPLTVTADNKTGPAGTVFTAFTATYSGFIPPDNEGNAFTNALKYGGNATNATLAGVYQIIPYGVLNTNYSITFVPGWLVLSTAPTTITSNVNVTWTGTSGANSNMTVFINQANGGSAGANPGWSLLYITNNSTATLTVNSTTADPFRIDLVTLLGSSAGRAAKFDPTRPYQWEIVRTKSGILNLTDYAQIKLNYDGAYLFQNPRFGGQFSVRLSGDTKSLYVDYNPVGAIAGVPEPVAIPSGYTVGSIDNTSTLLGDIRNSDVDMLYLDPESKTIAPATGTLVLNLRIANLKQPVIGAQAYINFDSRFFVATPAGTVGAPVVAPGDSTWDTPIYKMWFADGDLDAVMAVSINNAAGTVSDGIVAKITLTPTKWATGKSRVQFRADGSTAAVGTNLVTTSLTGTNGTAVLPARVMTDEITVTIDGNYPTIGAINAVQKQPHLGDVTVINGTVAGRQLTVATSPSGVQPTDTTYSGPVVITVNASDSGVGMAKAPVITLKKSGQTDIPIYCDDPNQTAGPFTYHWTVPSSTANGTWAATVYAEDTITNATLNGTTFTKNTTNWVDAFTLQVNTREIAGVVELEKFAGTGNRTVTFKVGDGDSGTTWNTSSNTWNVALNFVSGPILNAGAWRDREGMAAKIANPTDDMSKYLRYGSIANLSALAARLVNPTNNVDAYIYKLIYGDLPFLQLTANRLSTPTRSIDAYIVSLLSPATIEALAAYQAAALPKPADLAAALKVGLLNDFNDIILDDANLYNEVRFASVPSAAAVAGIPDQVERNRALLTNAYPSYVAGKLQATTARMLTGMTDPGLGSALLSEFDTITRTQSTWPIPAAPYDQGIYNQSVFLGVTLSQASIDGLKSFPEGDDLIRLNQLLLADAYPGIYTAPWLTPATVSACIDFNPETPDAFLTGMQTDLNAYIASGSGRANRQLLEQYYAEMSPSVLANYRLVQVPAGTTQVSAKTAWNLRQVLPVTTAAGSVAAASFVNDGTLGWADATDHYLRAGDVNSDNVVGLVDYNALRLGVPSTASADLNGDGRVNVTDAQLLIDNWGKGGGATDEVK